MTSAPPPAPPVDPPPAWEPPSPPAGPPARPQLRRSRTDKILGGVNGGLAEYSGIDPLLWRVGFVALAFAGGTGILVYLLLWLLMPAGPATSTATRRTARVPKRQAGPRSPVPGITMAALLIVVGVLVMIDRLTGADLGPRAFLGSALLVVGLGLVAASRARGRTARGGLIALGVLLSLALIAAANQPWRGYDGDVGDRSYLPGSADAVQREYHGGIGDLRLDLSDVDVGDLDTAIRTRVDAGLGDVTIIVPRDADVGVTVDSGIGSVEVFGQEGRSDGFFEGRGSGSWVGDDEPEIVLSVNAGIGSVAVDRA